ncbi:hypothetical protein HB968_14360 [Listeria welshimeri]|nr:hypothetical protein [Listeria welshimeri]
MKLSFTEENKKQKKAREFNTDIDEDNYIGEKGTSIFGGWLGDHDKRTKKSFRAFLVLLLAFVLLIGGTVFSVKGSINYKAFVKGNTTDIGVTLNYSVSNAKVTLKNVFSDKNHDLTIVQLGYSSQSHELLPAQGINYGINIITKSKEDIPANLKVEYGLLGTDGDGYLFLKGKLKEQSYQVFLTNHLDLSVDENYEVDNNTAKLSDESSLTSEISRNSYQNMDDNGIVTNKEDEGLLDKVNFRVNSYSNSTKIYDGSFLKSDGSINYEKVIDVMALSDLKSSTKQLIQKGKEQLKAIDSRIEEYEGRLNINEKDTQSQELLDEAKEQKENIEKKQMEYEEQLKNYSNIIFSKKDFGKTQTEVNIIEESKLNAK